MRVARVDPGARSTSARVGFRLGAAAQRRRAAAPRRRRRSSCCSPRTPRAPRQIAQRARPRQRRAPARRARILFEAEAQIGRRSGSARAYVLAGEGWHPGVIGIVASRIAERHHRPVRARRARRRRRARLGAHDPGLRPARRPATRCAEHLRRYGGHRAAAGARDRARAPVDALARRVQRARRGACSAPRTWSPVERVDAVVARRGARPGAGRGAAGARAVRHGQSRACLADARRRGFADSAPMGEGKHVRFTVRSGGRGARGRVRRRARARRSRGRPRRDASRWRSTSGTAQEPRLVLRRAQPASAAARPARAGRRHPVPAGAEEHEELVLFACPDRRFNPRGRSPTLVSMARAEDRAPRRARRSPRPRGAPRPGAPDGRGGDGRWAGAGPRPAPAGARRRGGPAASCPASARGC